MPSNTHTHPPALFSPLRIVSLLCSLLVALGSGTNYVFSAYGPQLGARLHLSHTQQNIIGLSGNVGVYGTAPLLGRLVDYHGPRILIAMAFTGLLGGYLGMYHFYDSGLPIGSTDLPVLSFCLLALCGFMTGVGGNGGLCAAMNSTAKSFPDRLRATTNGLVLSGFGLSAFLFSTIAHVIFPGNTSAFLLVLAIGTSLPMILGFFFVKPVPLPHFAPTHAIEHGQPAAPGFTSASLYPPPSAVFQRDNNSHTHLLARDDDDEEDPVYTPPGELNSTSVHFQQASDYVVPSQQDAVPLSPTRTHSRHRSRSAFSVSRSTHTRNKSVDSIINVSGKRLFASVDFWLLFTITSLLSGTGLMYINNVGSISQALFAQGNPAYDEVKSAQIQAAQVSIISVMNCLGRVLIGMLADLTKNKLDMPRSFFVSLVASLFIISQCICLSIVDVNSLWKVSTLLGLAYGAMFGLFPTIAIEWFGLPHFSENWGFVSLSPMIGGNVFSLAFGHNLDLHTPAQSSSTGAPFSTRSSAAFLASPDVSAHQCLDGRECYIDSLKMTITACCVALGLAIYAGWRDRRKTATAILSLRGRSRETEILWEDNSD